MRMYFPSRLPTWRLGERDYCYSNDVIFVREKHSSEDLALLCAVFQELEIIYWLRHVEMEFSFCQVRTCFRISADITQLSETTLHNRFNCFVTSILSVFAQD